MNIENEVRRAFFALCDDNKEFPNHCHEVKTWKVGMLVTYAFYNKEGVAPELFDYSKYINRGLLHCDTFGTAKGFKEQVMSICKSHFPMWHREVLNVA